MRLSRRLILWGMVGVWAAGAAGDAWAKPRQCFTKAEITADLIVRHGVFLREASKRCDETVPGSKQLWDDFDKAFGSRLLAERRRREAAFKREFGNDWLKAVTTFDARIVTYDRYYYNTSEFCKDVKSKLDDNKKKGWGSFAKQSKVLKDASAIFIVECGP